MRRGLKRFHKERKGLAKDTSYYQVKQLEDNNQVDLEEGGVLIGRITLFRCVSYFVDDSLSLLSGDKNSYAPVLFPDYKEREKAKV